MKKIMLTIAVAILGGLAAVKGDEPASRPSNTVKAFRGVRIDAPNVYLDVVQEFEKDYLSAIRQGPGIVPNIDIEQSAVNDAPELLISVEAQVSTGAPADAAETADLVLGQLRSRLATLTQQQRAVWKSDMASQYRENQSLEQQRISLEQRLKLLHSDVEKISAYAGLADVSPQSVLELLQTLEGQYEATGIDIEGKAARQAALANAIAKLGDEVELKLNADLIAQQLQVVVDERNKALDADNGLFKIGGAQMADITRDTAALAEAKAAVLERKEAAAEAAGADTIHRWNDDLLSLSVDLAELHARSDALKNRLEMLKKAMDEMEGRPSEDSLEKSLEAVNDQLDKLQLTLNAEKPVAGLAAAQPKLTVLESTDETAAKN
jgi:cell division protein FtsB